MDASRYKTDRRKFDAATEQTLKDKVLGAEQHALPWHWTEHSGVLRKIKKVICTNRHLISK